MLNEDYYRRRAHWLLEEFRGCMERRCPHAARARLRALMKLDREYREIYGLPVAERELDAMEAEIAAATARRGNGKGR